MADLTFSIKAQDLASDTITKIRGGFESIKNAAIGIASVAALRQVGGFLFEAAQSAAAEETAMNRLRLAVAAAGGEWGRAGPALQGFVDRMKAAGIAGSSETIPALQRMITLTGDYDRAVELSGLAADVAAGLQMDLGAAVQLVARAAEGATQGLGRQIPELREVEELTDKATSAQERARIAIELLGERFGGMSGQLAGMESDVKRAAEAWGDFRQAIGEVVIEHGFLQDLLRGSADALRGFIERAHEARTGEAAAAAATAEATAKLRLQTAAFHDLEAAIATGGEGGAAGAFARLTERLEAAGERLGDLEVQLRTFGTEPAGLREARAEVDRLTAAMENLETARTLGEGVAGVPLRAIHRGADPGLAKKAADEAARAARETEAAMAAAFGRAADLVKETEALSEQMGRVGEAAAHEALRKYAEDMSELADMTERAGRMTGKMDTDLRRATHGLFEMSDNAEDLSGKVSGLAGVAVVSFEQLGMAAYDAATQASAVVFGQFSELFAFLVAGSEISGRAFAANMIKAVGQVAVQLGSMLVLAGTSLAFLPGMHMSFGAVAGGLGLIALGGVLAGVASRVGGGSGGASAGGGASAFEARGSFGAGRREGELGQTVVINVNTGLATADHVAQAVGVAWSRARTLGMVPAT